MNLTGADIVCLASSSWDAMWVNSQHLMHRLAAQNRVLYVNNLGLRAPGASRGDWHKITRRVGEWFSGLRQAEPNLWVFSPVSLPLHDHASIRRFNQWNLKRTLRRHLTDLGFKQPLLWTFLPLGVQLIGSLDESLVIYHCVDDYAANPGVPAARLREMEDQLLRLADLTIVTNPLLYEERKSRARQAAFFGNVADAEHFAPRPDRPLPLELAALPRPLLGYQGNISGYKTNLEWIAALAKAMPAASVVLIGPVGWGDPHTDVSALQALPNVHLLGRMPYERLPELLAALDICLLPLHDNESTRRSFPMKFYEYMAAAKPIVATDLPAFATYRDRPQLCRLATDADSFVAGVRAALADADDHAAERLAEARLHSWRTRTEQIAALVAQTWQEKEARNESATTDNPEMERQ
ncbi:MAG: glycosyltransferase family 1 protein [Myxococcales bacterium]|nr:glycosyltransferase family 1 protein [Myxococcales bacterium]